jgi:hypothetical protein
MPAREPDYDHGAAESMHRWIDGLAAQPVQRRDDDRPSWRTQRGPERRQRIMPPLKCVDTWIGMSRIANIHREGRDTATFGCGDEMAA